MIYFEIDDFIMLRKALKELEEKLRERDVCPESIFDSKLVADELLSNVLQHGGKRAYFKAALNGEELSLFVQSEVKFRPPEKSTLSSPLAESGRGLFIVDALCLEREYSDEEGVKVILKIQKDTL